MGAGAAVAAAAADDQLVVDDQRSRGQRAIAVRWIVELDGLHQFAGVRLGPQHLAVAGDGNDEVLVEGNATVRGYPHLGLVDARIHDPGDLGLLRVAHVDLVDGAEAVNDVHPAIVDQRRALMAAQGHRRNADGAAKRDSESNVKVLDVVLVDLVKLGIAM